MNHEARILKYGLRTKKIAFIIVIILTVFIFFYFNNSNQNSVLCPDCNIVLITMTNLRYDHISSNGYFRQTTPNIDNLAKDSIVFDNTFGHSSWTLPESMSIYTSLYPYEHRIMNRIYGQKLSKSTPTLVDILSKNGYKTAAFTGGFDYNPEFGLIDRFDTTDTCNKIESLPFENSDLSKIQSGPNQYGELNCSVPKAMKWINDNKDQKFFVHVQGYDAHCPFSQRGGEVFDKSYDGNIDYRFCLWTFGKSDPISVNGEAKYPVYSSITGTEKNILLGEKDISHLKALYDESIFFADKEVGFLLQAIEDLGLDKKTIVVFTSEHGDMLGEKGRFMRGGPLRGTFYDDVIHVPFMIRHPKIDHKRLDSLVSHIDIAPTILDLVRLKFESQISGKSLISLIKGEEENIRDYIFAGSEYTPDSTNPYFFKRTRAETVRDREWKLIRETIFDENNQETLEFYNISEDHDEQNSIFDSNEATMQDMISRLNDWSSKIED
jgi:choline-sulfatase